MYKFGIYRGLSYCPAPLSRYQIKVEILIFINKLLWSCPAPLYPSRAFDDSSLPSTGPAILKERSLEIEKLRQTKPHLLVKLN